MEENQTNLKKKQIKWITFIIIIGSVILILVGFVFGYLTAKPCSGNPLVYGIKQINEINNENYECSCKSGTSFDSFFFDEEKIQEKRKKPNPYNPMILPAVFQIS